MHFIEYPNGRRDRAESVGEKVADAIIHGVAILAGLIGLSVLFVLVAQRGDLATGLALGVYALGVLALFSFSAAYNLVPPSPLKWLLRRFDHSSIYLMIAGTYTPLLIQLHDKTWAWIMGIVVWTGAVLGIVIKVGFPHRFDKISIAAYVALGWVIVFAFGPLAQSLSPASLVLVAVGGLLYCSGIGFYLWRNLKYQSAIWHSFVAAAAGCHFASIAICVA